MNQPGNGIQFGFAGTWLGMGLPLLAARLRAAGDLSSKQRDKKPLKTYFRVPFET